MVKKPKKAAKVPQKAAKAPRRPRTDAAMAKANRRIDFRVHEKIRGKKISVKKDVKLMKKKNKEVKEWRTSLSGDRKHVLVACETAAEHFRAVVRGFTRSRAPPRATKRVRTPRVLAHRPSNWDKLMFLLPPNQRSKPIAVGEDVVWLPHTPTPADQWNRAIVAHLKRRNQTKTNWVVVAKPWVLRPKENPYLAIDSTNVWMAPTALGGGGPTMALLPNLGVYVIYCPALDEYYVGQSNDVGKRLDQHRKGTAAKFTKRWSEFYRVRPLTPPHGTYRSHETREVLAIAKKCFKGKITSYIGRDTIKVRGGGYSLSQ